MQIRFHLHESPTIVRFTELESATVVPGAEEREPGELLRVERQFNGNGLLGGEGERGLEMDTVRTVVQQGEHT